MNDCVQREGVDSDTQTSHFLERPVGPGALVGSGAAPGGEIAYHILHTIRSTIDPFLPASSLDLPQRAKETWKKANWRSC